MSEFDKLWFDCMNGDSRETGKLTPDGKPDPSVFSTDYNREGIRVGTAICVIVRKPKRQKKPTGPIPRIFGARDKRARITWRAWTARSSMRRTRRPTRAGKSLFLPSRKRGAALHANGRSSPTSARIAPFNGPVERAGDSLIRIAGQADDSTPGAYLDPAVADSEIQAVEPRFMLSSGEFRAIQTRNVLKGKVKYQPRNIVRYPFKPFDVRAAYLDPAIQPLFSRPSPQLLAQSLQGNAFFLTRDTADKSPEGSAVLLLAAASAITTPFPVMHDIFPCCSRMACDSISRPRPRSSPRWATSPRPTSPWQTSRAPLGNSWKGSSSRIRTIPKWPS